jgi:hypothetical protein
VNILNPFGPPVGRFEISYQKVEELNECAERILKSYNAPSDKIGLTHYHDYEIAIPRIDINVLNEFTLKVTEYLNKCWTGKNKVELINAWFNCMQSSDFNPVHNHKKSGHIAVVGFLKLPDNFKNERDYETKINKKTGAGMKYPGCLNLFHGNSTYFSNSVVRIQPEVGSFYIFPSDISHSVNPYTSNGERRSLAINFAVKNSNQYI